MCYLVKVVNVGLGLSVVVAVVSGEGCQGFSISHFIQAHGRPARFL